MLRIINNSKFSIELSNVFCSKSNISPENCIDVSSTGVSYYDDFLDDSKIKYFRDKNLEGHIEYMTPLEYYEACAEIFNSSVESLKQQRRNDNSSIDWLTNALERGQKFNLPYVDFANAGQEGLHRMMVLADIFGWSEFEFPVLVVNYIDSDLQNISEAHDCLQKAIDNSLDYRYAIDTLPDHLFSQIQFEIDKSREYEDFGYDLVLVNTTSDSYVVSLKGFENKVKIEIQKDDIELSILDEEDMRVDEFLSTLSDDVNLDDIDIDDLIKSFR